MTEFSGCDVAENVTTPDGAPHDDMVAAPAMVGAVSVDGERPAEIRRGEGGDALGHAQFGHGCIERGEGVVDLCKQAWQIGGLTGMGVETAGADEEDLAGGEEAVADRNRLRDGAEL